MPIVLEQVGLAGANSSAGTITDTMIVCALLARCGILPH